MFNFRFISFLFNTIVFTLISANIAFSQLVVNNSMNAQQLVQNILLGSGVTVSNIQYTGAVESVGSFTGTSSNIGIQSGIILSTGNINDAVGPNNSGSSGEDLSQNGDAQLTSIAGNDTYDAAVLEFDFIPSSDTIRFNYVFGSEEYPEYVCSNFNDVFAFFLSGPNPLGGNYTNKNIAIIPGTLTPVAINSLNNGSPGSSYSSSSCTSLAYSSYYVDNTNGSTVQYDGFTKILQAEAHVIACQTYHIKLAIADATDGAYDSGVFLEAKSFSSPTVSISAIGSTSDSLMVEGCGAAVFTFTRDNASGLQPFVIHYLIGGTATNGADYQDINGNQIADSIVFFPGQDSAFLYINPVFDGTSETDETIILSIPQILSCTNDTARATIYIKNVDPMNISIYGDTLICAQLGEVSDIVATLSGGYGPFQYIWEPNIGTSSSIQVMPAQTSTYTLAITDTCGHASVSNSITVVVECPIEIPNIFTPNSDGSNDGFTIKNLDQYPKSSLIVFNRWGKQVYENSDYKNDWKGKDCADGVYYYILNQSKKNKSYHGTVTILR